jgi:hypothetical protein
VFAQLFSPFHLCVDLCLASVSACYITSMSSSFSASEDCVGYSLHFYILSDEFNSAFLLDKSTLRFYILLET